MKIYDNKLTTYLTINTKYKYSKTFYYKGKHDNFGNQMIFYLIV